MYSVLFILVKRNSTAIASSSISTAKGKKKSLKLFNQLILVNHSNLPLHACQPLSIVSHSVPTSVSEGAGTFFLIEVTQIESCIITEIPTVSP